MGCGWSICSVGRDPVVVLLPESLLSFELYQWRAEKAGENFRYFVNLGVWHSMYVTLCI